VTPRERWDAAVALQHQTVAQIARLPLDEAGDSSCTDLVNRATYELMEAYRELRYEYESHAWRGSEPHPLYDLLMPEWYAAYNLHREAMFQRERVGTLYRATLAIDEQCLAMARVYSAIPSHLKVDSTGVEA